MIWIGKTEKKKKTEFDRPDSTLQVEVNTADKNQQNKNQVRNFIMIRAIEANSEVIIVHNTIHVPFLSFNHPNDPKSFGSYSIAL